MIAALHPHRRSTESVRLLRGCCLFLFVFFFFAVFEFLGCHNESAPAASGEGNPVGKDPRAPEKIPGCFTPMPTKAQIQQYKKVFQQAVQAHQQLTPLFPQTSTADEVAKALALQPTDAIADVGAGTGPFEIMLLEKQYPFAKLYAVDIDAAALDFFRFLLDTAKLPGSEKVEPVRSSMTDTKLPPDSVDVLFLLNTPIFLPDPVAGQFNQNNQQTLQSMIRALKPGGRFHIFHEKLSLFSATKPETVTANLVSLGLVTKKEEIMAIGDQGGREFNHWFFTKP